MPSCSAARRRWPPVAASAARMVRASAARAASPSDRAAAAGVGAGQRVDDQIVAPRAGRRSAAAARAGGRCRARGNCRASRGRPAGRAPPAVGNGKAAAGSAWRSSMAAAIGGMSRRRLRSGVELERHDVEAPVEVGAEAAGGDFGGEVAIGAGDDAHVDRLGRGWRRPAALPSPAARAAAWPGARAASRRSRRAAGCRRWPRGTGPRRRRPRR